MSSKRPFNYLYDDIVGLVGIFYKVFYLVFAIKRAERSRKTRLNKQKVLMNTELCVSVIFSVPMVFNIFCNVLEVWEGCYM